VAPPTTTVLLMTAGTAPVGTGADVAGLAGAGAAGDDAVTDSVAAGVAAETLGVGIACWLPVQPAAVKATAAQSPITREAIAPEDPRPGRVSRRRPTRCS
jgi:hypothetical protein